MSRLALAAGGLLLLAGCASGRGPRPLEPPPRLEGLPLAVTAPDVQGRPVQIEADGARVRVVDFFASWCEPCRAQFPALDRIARAYAARGVRVYGVSFDEVRPPLDRFLQEHPVTFPILHDPAGASVGAGLEIHRLPTTLLVDGAGVIRWVHEGYQAGDGEELERRIRALLDGE